MVLKPTIPIFKKLQDLDIKNEIKCFHCKEIGEKLKPSLKKLFMKYKTVLKCKPEKTNLN